MNLAGSRISCGALQVYGLYETPEAILKKVGERFYVKAGPLPSATTASGQDDSNPAGRKSAFVIFSDGADGKWGGGKIGGPALAAFIEEQGLGAVAKGGPVNNPSYRSNGTMICLWCWTVDHEKFEKWYKKVTP